MISFVEEARKLIAMRSMAEGGNEEIATYCQALMNAQGFRTHTQQITHSYEGISKRQFNVIGIMGDTLVDVTTKKGLLISNHLDTATPGIESQWTECVGDPFKATLRDDTVYGLGAANAKLAFLCVLMACERYRDRKFKKPLYLVCTAGTEFGGLGAKFLTKSMVINPEIVVVSAPTGLEVVTTQKQNSVYKLSVYYNQLEKDAKGYNTKIEVRCQGRAAYGGYPGYGDNAVLRALRFIENVKKANFQIKLTKISGGDSANKVPDSALLEFYVSSSAFEDFKKFHRENLPQEMSDDLKYIQVEYGGLGETGMRFFGDNVINAVSDAWTLVEDLRRSVLTSGCDDFDQNESTINLCSVKQESGCVSMWLDLRLLPQINSEKIDLALRERINTLNTKYPNLMFKLQKERVVPALVQNKESSGSKVIEDILQLVGQGQGKALPSICSDAAHYSAAGYDAIAFGPGVCAGNSHSPNEGVSIDQLDRAVQFYDRIIERYCL